MQSQEDANLLTSRHATLFSDAFGRLRPGATLAQAQAEAAAAAANSPDFLNQSGRPSTRPRIGPVLTAGAGRDAYTGERLTTIFTLLMGAVGLLLLLACANAANLLLARGASRRREIAVCQAIGASRLRIVRQLFIEGVVLSTAAGAAGLALAVWLTSLFDGMRILTFLPSVTGVGIDWRVCAFAFAAALGTGVVFATAPAIVSSRVELQPSLKDGITSSRHGRRFVRGSLVVIQVAVSVLLLVGAGLFIRTLHNIRTLDLGLDLKGLVSAGVEPGRYGYATARSQAYVRDLLDRLRSAPGVESAAFTQTTPYSSGRNETAFVVPDAPGGKIVAAATHVSLDFFKTMRIPILAGRDFTATEVAAFGTSRSKQGVVIVSKGLADKLFPNGGAVGSRVTLSYPKGKIAEVVGIAGDVRGRPLTDDPEPWAYAPTSAPTWGQIQVRSSLPPAEAIGTIRDVARALDPVVMPHDIESFGASIDRVLSEQRLFARLSGLFAAVAGVLAAIGIYGMMAGTVAERRREFGIRIALGARAATVLRQVMRTAVWLAVPGVVFGVFAAAGLRRLIEARLYGVTGLDPATIAAASCAIVLLSIAASLVPAVRATRIDPAISLRSD
jgi:predicted permease